MTIDALPQAPSTDDPDNFDDEADALLAALNPMVAQINAATEQVSADVDAAAASAVAAAGSASDASSSKTAAASSASTATGAAVTAAAAAAAAATSAAAASGTQIVSTSTSAVLIGTGAKTFVTQAGKQFVTGVPVIAVDTANSANAIAGTIASYNGTTLVIASLTPTGSGTPTSWNISIAGVQGAQGPGNAAGNAAGAINELKAPAAPASSAAPDVWNAGGNRVPITQTAAITGFPNAPQAGAQRTLVIINGCPLTAGANLIVHGGSRSLVPGDEVDVVAETISSFVATIRLNSGAAVVSQSFTNAELLLASAPFTAKKTGIHRAIMWGAGGAGGDAQNVHSVSGMTSVCASGGQGGGLCIKSFFMTAGQTAVFSAGAPGAAAVNAAGGDSGATSLTYPGGTLNITGSKGGSSSMVGGLPTNNPAPGATSGAIATGGDENYQGGGSGGCSGYFAGTGSLVAQATGGGGVPYKGVTYVTGSVSVTAIPTTTAAGYTGGMGVGGGSSSVTLGSAGGVVSSANGGSLGPGVGTTVGAGSSVLIVSPLDVTGDGVTTTNTNGNPRQMGGAYQNFGGRPGFASASTGIAYNPATPGWGGGSGGTACTEFSSVSVNNTAGGIAGCLIQY
jgi:hypothetical protein